MPRFAILIGVIALSAMVSGCTTRSAALPSAQQSSSSILVSSHPAAGTTVQSVVESLELHFNPPARLDEVAITGPDGVMPMMVHSVGEVGDYSLPLSGLRAGSYVVNWRATARGRGYRGSLQFNVRE
jgi:methionine-rich copper-binding protein CopC